MLHFISLQARSFSDKKEHPTHLYVYQNFFLMKRTSKVPLVSLPECFRFLLIKKFKIPQMSLPVSSIELYQGKQYVIIATDSVFVTTIYIITVDVSFWYCVLNIGGTCTCSVIFPRSIVNRAKPARWTIFWGIMQLSSRYEYQ